jgi:hypothetical protein
MIHVSSEHQQPVALPWSLDVERGQNRTEYFRESCGASTAIAKLGVAAMG